MRSLLALSSLLFVTAAPSFGQSCDPVTSAAARAGGAPPRVPGAAASAPATTGGGAVNDALPEFRLEAGEQEVVLGPEGRRVLATGGVTLTWGDVRLQADRLEYDPETQRFVAAGGMTWTRGDEVLRGDSFVFDPANGVAVAENAVAISPPFYVSGRRIERTPTGLLARDAMITPCPEGKGEVRLTGREVEIVDDRYLILRRPTLSLFGVRLLSLPRYRQVLTRGRRREREEYALSIPVRVRSSEIAGLVVGASYPFTLAKNLVGDASVDLPSKRPTQYVLSVRRDFLGDVREPVGRGDFVDPTRRDRDNPADSPLRRFLRARPVPPPPDPVLDFEDIVPTENPLSFPARIPARDLRGTLTVAGNREISGKRTGDLLLSRLPEARLFGALPLTAPPPEENAAARTYLRRPRLLLTGDVSIGSYQERELTGDNRSVSRARAAATLGVGTLPLLVGSRVLVRPQMLFTYQTYNRGESYKVAEANLAAGYVLGPRTALGVAYIRRFTSGTTPFTFDVVDTQDEAQARAQVSFGRYTLGTLLRYDVTQRQFFDFEVALGIRMRCIEPRLSYRRLGQQIGLSFTIPGLTQP
uniref:LPS-assembly protein LptD n=1 Tax=uncultured Armatimonadetes bacterium TaxID=157466 RepID=A0A6J4ITV7_9BACT|nr:hypothetical protein AVDCRST_MAG63-2458 [uncultured Armatimonadetes bacterium]